MIFCCGNCRQLLLLSALVATVIISETNARIVVLLPSDAGLKDYSSHQQQLKKLLTRHHRLKHRAQPRLEDQIGNSDEQKSVLEPVSVQKPVNVKRYVIMPNSGHNPVLPVFEKPKLPVFVVLKRRSYLIYPVPTDDLAAFYGYQQ